MTIGDPPIPPFVTASPASITIDLDNLWSYLKTQGLSGWEDYPSYLPVVVPQILDALSRHKVIATFFIVGRDATRSENKAPLQAIADAGHEIACHSFDHEPCLHLYSESELETEFDRAEEAIEAATGARPLGFRGPGFSCSDDVRHCLVSRGYTYDSSSFPTFLGPLARLYFHFTAKLPQEERERRSGLYGGIKQGFANLRPHRLESGLVEFPVTTMPIARVPMHQTYLLFLAQRSLPLARLFWGVARGTCSLVSLPPTLLLHPTDFLDLDDVPAMSFFPGMKLPRSKKIELIDVVLGSVTSRHPVSRLDQRAAAMVRDQETAVSAFPASDSNLSPQP